MDQVWHQKWVEEVRKRKQNNDPFTLKDYVSMCIDMEAHETETHNKYAEVARTEGREEIANMFSDLAGGEDFFSERFKKILKEWR